MQPFYPLHIHAMKTYDILIDVTVSRTATITAETEEEAKTIARDEVRDDASSYPGALVSVEIVSCELEE